MGEGLVNKVILAYAAGIMDGEGCIHIRRRKKYNCFWPHIYDLQVVVSTTDGILADWFYERFGGHICKCKLRTTSNYPKYQWCIQANQATGFLRKVLPYLLLKKQQAELAIKFQDKKKIRQKHRFKNARPWIVYKYEDNTWMKLRQLKRIKLCVF